MTEVELADGYADAMVRWTRLNDSNSVESGIAGSDYLKSDVAKRLNVHFQAIDELARLCDALLEGYLVINKPNCTEANNVRLIKSTASHRLKDFERIQATLEAKADVYPGLELTKEVQSNDVMWLIQALLLKGWIEKLPSDDRLPKIFLKDGTSAFTYETYKKRPATVNFDMSQADAIAAVQDPKFRAFLQSFPSPNGRSNKAAEKP